MEQEIERPLGIATALAAAATLGVITTLAALTYQGGASARAVIETRYILAVVIMGGLGLVLGRNFHLPRALRPRLLGAALGYFFMTMGYLSSVAYIPVSLAAVIFYTYPLMVAALSPWVEGRRQTAKGLAAFVLAFAGLALALGPELTGLDWRGVAWAALGATGSASIFLFSRGPVSKADVLVTNFYINLLCAVLMLVVILIFGGFALPTTTLSQGTLTGASFAYVLAIVLIMLAVRQIGAARAALFFNLEPLISIAMAMALLGERLNLWQGMGVGLVLAALMLAARAPARAVVQSSKM